MRYPETNRWSHPNVILVATDLSDLEHLMPVALAQAKENAARLILFHVVSASATINADAAGMPYYDAVGALETSEQMMHSWCEIAHQRGILCDAFVREGQATQQILAAVRQFHVDRVLLGTRSRSKIGKLLLGSVAEQVLRSVYVPVMTVGPEAHLQVPRNGETTILFATTLREASSPSAALAGQIATVRGSRLLLLHVLPAVSKSQHQDAATEVDSATQRELRNLSDQTEAECHVKVEPLLIYGNPTIEILAAAEDCHADLIVLTATDRRAFENLTRDRTIYSVLAHARCPVLTVREAHDVPHEASDRMAEMPH